MITVQNTTGQVRLPLYCVVRNIEQSASIIDSPYDVADLRGGFVGLTPTYEYARRLVPQPAYPEGAIQQERFHARFGWKHVQISDGMIVQQVPTFGFDDNPGSVYGLRSQGLAPDTELFGESYTVFWICPPDPEVIADTLLDHVQQLHSCETHPSSLRALLERHGELNPYARPCKTIDGFLLLYVWQHYFDRMCLQVSNDSDHEHRDVCKVAREMFVTQVNQLPRGPSADDWKRLDELRTK